MGLQVVGEADADLLALLLGEAGEAGALGVGGVVLGYDD